jgi:hypothetical protein
MDGKQMMKALDINKSKGGAGPVFGIIVKVQYYYPVFGIIVKVQYYYPVFGIIVQVQCY